MLRFLTWVVLFLGLLVFVLGCPSSQTTADAPGRVMVLGLDGIDPDAVASLIADGKLPNFAMLQERGAWGPLKSSEPMLSPILWTTMATGRFPADHGISNFTFSEVGAQKTPVSSAMRRVEAIWNIVSSEGKTVDVVGWWATWPPEEVNGTIVSDRACFHFLFEDGETGRAASDDWVSPSTRADDLGKLIRRPQDISWEEARRFIDVSRDRFDQKFEFEDDVSHFKWALATTQSYTDISLKLWESDAPDLLLNYIEGTDSVSHLFGHLFRSPELKGELGEQQAQFGRVVEEIYVLADEIVGRYIEAMDDDTTLMILSDHGFKLGQLHDDPSVTRSMKRVSSKYHAPNGIVYLFGNRIKPAAIIGAEQTDITPTILGLLGLPIAEDMPGRILSEAVSDLPDRPATIPSYERGDRSRPDSAPAADDQVDAEVLQHLEALGYLGGDEEPAGIDEGDQDEDGMTALARASRADILLNSGDIEGAKALYLTVVDELGDRPTLFINLGLIANYQGNLDEAENWLRKAITIDPGQPLAWNNLGVTLEKAGRNQGAIEAYKKALQLDPNMRGAAVGLRRLTGSSVVYQPQSPEEEEALRMIREAAGIGRQGDYEGAARMIEQAKEMAPDFVPIYMYLGNVRYLQGDYEAARDALREAVRLDPGNVNAAKNLAAAERRLQSVQ